MAVFTHLEQPPLFLYRKIIPFFNTKLPKILSVKNSFILSSYRKYFLSNYYHSVLIYFTPIHFFSFRYTLLHSILLRSITQTYPYKLVSKERRSFLPFVFTLVTRLWKSYSPNKKKNASSKFFCLKQFP